MHKFDSGWLIQLVFSPSRLSLEDTQQWSQSLERLLESKCRFFLLLRMRRLFKHEIEFEFKQNKWFKKKLKKGSVFVLSPDGLATFHNFLKSEHSDENIEFWLTCEDYKKNRSSYRMSSKAKKIYEQFIKVESPKEVSQAQSKCKISHLLLLAQIPSFLSACLIADQHWLSNSRADQKERQDSHYPVLWRSSEDSLWADGKRLVPTVSPLGHL